MTQRARRFLLSIFDFQLARSAAGIFLSIFNCPFSIGAERSEHE
jgi:hypothetical protein